MPLDGMTMSALHMGRRTKLPWMISLLLLILLLLMGAMISW